MSARASLSGFAAQAEFDDVAKSGVGMGKAEATVEELVRKIERGELGLPEMQRQYVWKAPRVRDLFDSLYRGYPSGAILLWETDEQVPLQDFAVSQQAGPYQSRLLLLDGQQRLTSLSALIRGEPVTVRNRKRPIDLLFNLDHPDGLSVVSEVNEEADDDEAAADDAADVLDEEVDSTEDELLRRFERMTFVVASKKLAAMPNWVKVSEVFKTDQDAPFLLRAGVKGFEDPRFTKYSQRLANLRAIRSYVYRMDVLEPILPYDEVTEIFVRVNSLGAKLRSSDLALAQITAKWRNSLSLFQKFQAHCANVGFSVELGIHLRAMVAFATGQSRFLTVGTLSLEALQEAWAASCRGMEFAMNFLKRNVGVSSPALLSSPFILVSIAYFGHVRHYELSPDIADQLRRWVLLANAKGRYSRGSSETLLDQDLATIRAGGDAAALLDRLRGQVGRLELVAADLAGRNQRSSLFKTMFLAFQAAGARDWSSNLAIAIDHSGAQDKLQFHHVFPKALLRRHGRPPREADDIANLAFIGGKTNRSISDKPPGVYLKPILEAGNRALLAPQCMPTDEELLDVDNYDKFLAARRDLIVERLNAFLDVEGLDASGERVDPALQELDKRIVEVELGLRRQVDAALGGDARCLPEHVRQKAGERLASARRTNPAAFADSDEPLRLLLEYCDLRELQDIITAKTLWDRFAGRFGTKENLGVRFGQLGLLRNGIRHTRTVDVVTRKDGEAALLWFRQALANGQPPYAS